MSASVPNSDRLGARHGGGVYGPGLPIPERAGGLRRGLPPINVSRRLYGWKAVLDRIGAPYSNRNVEYRLRLQSGDRRTADVLNLTRYRGESLGQDDTLFAEGYPPRRRVFSQRDGAAPQSQSCRWRSGYGHASRILSGSRGRFVLDPVDSPSANIRYQTQLASDNQLDQCDRPSPSA